MRPRGSADRLESASPSGIETARRGADPHRSGPAAGGAQLGDALAEYQAAVSGR